MVYWTTATAGRARRCGSSWRMCGAGCEEGTPSVSSSNSDTVTSLMSYKNGFELLDAFGYALCSKLGVNWVPLVLAPETM